VVDGHGNRLPVTISAANVNDCRTCSLPWKRSRRFAGYEVNHGAAWRSRTATKGCDSGVKWRVLRAHGIVPALDMARHRIEGATGRDRWVVERTQSWLNRIRRLEIRYALICWRLL
jgi:transposase